MLYKPGKSDRANVLVAGKYTLVGRPESGYTIKMLSALRFKGVPHQWMDRFENDKLYSAHAKVPLLPLMFLPDGRAEQDSTPLLELLEQQHPEPSFHPADPALRFLSELMEEYGDEWANKLMFHYRWGYPADQKRRSRSLAEGIISGRLHPVLGKLFGPLFALAIVRRMVPRMAFAGANDNNAPILIESFANLVDMLETHLQTRPYLFGARPSFGDFGLWGQMYQAYVDSSCETILNKRAPTVVDWIKRMLEPSVQGDFEPLDSLAPTLWPIFAREIGPRFLAWDIANAKAWDAGEKQTELIMEGQRYYQKTFKYPARTLRILIGKFARCRDNPALRDFLKTSGCWEYLTDPSIQINA